MASTRFNNNILTAARRLQQNRTVAGSAGDTGNRYTSARLADYQNRAIRELIKAQFEKSPDTFALRFPQMVKTSDPVTIDSLPRIAIPTEAWYITELWVGTLKFKRIADQRIGDVLSGVDKLIVPSLTEPAFYVENGYIYLLPDAGLTGDARYRFIKEHVDISVNTSASGVGNKSTITGNFTLADKKLSITMTTDFTDNDIGKRVIFATVDLLGTLTGVYESVILARSSGTVVTLGSGDYLPSANTIVYSAMVSDLTPDLADINLSRYEDGAIVDTMVALALADQASKQ